MSESERTEALAKLLEEGARSYPEALAALHEFRAEVVKRSKRVLQRRLAELEEVTAFKLREAPVQPHINPDPDADIPVFLETRNPDCWVAIKLPWGRWQSYFGLYWRHDKDSGFRAGAIAMIDAGRRNLGDQLMKAISAAGGRQPLRFWRNEVCFWEPIPDGAMCTFEHRLDDLISEWVRVWSKANLRAVLPPNW